MNNYYFTVILLSGWLVGCDLIDYHPYDGRLDSGLDNYFAPVGEFFVRNRSMTASHFRSILKFSVNKNKTFIQKGDKTS